MAHRAAAGPRLGHCGLGLDGHLDRLLKHLLRRLRLVHLSKSLVDLLGEGLAVDALDATHTLLHATIGVDDELQLLCTQPERQRGR